MIFGLPLRNPQPPSPNAPVYPALSVWDIVLFVLHSLYIIFLTCSPYHILTATVTTLCYILFVLPLELVLEPSPYHRTVPDTIEPKGRLKLSARHIPASLPSISLLQDLTIRLCRHALQSFPHSIIRAFFSERNVLSLFVARMGGPDEFYKHCAKTQLTSGSIVEGWWVCPHIAPILANYPLPHLAQYEEKPDVILMYLHGGGFTFCQPPFYIELLYRLTLELQSKGFKRPAIFAPVYGLAPERVFPYQLGRAMEGWKYVCDTASRERCSVGIGGDSAGGGLAVAVMLKIAELSPSASEGMRRPDFAALISPWSSTLNPPSERNLPTDFIDPVALSHFAHAYTSAQPSFVEIDTSRTFYSFLSRHIHHLFSPSSPRRNSYSTPAAVLQRHRDFCHKHPLASPLDFLDPDQTWWYRAIPRGGLLVAYGRREVLAEDCLRLINTFRTALASKFLAEDRVLGQHNVVEEVTWDFCHAPVVVHCFLGRDSDERAEGVRIMAEFIRRSVDRCLDDDPSSKR